MRQPFVKPGFSACVWVGAVFIGRKAGGRKWTPPNTLPPPPPPRGKKNCASRQCFGPGMMFMEMKPPGRTTAAAGVDV